jgi:hypothetical protein
MLAKPTRCLRRAGILCGATLLAAAAPVNPQSPIEVTQWNWTGPDGTAGGPRQRPTFDEPPGGPLYLWLRLDGGETALDDIRDRGALTIEVHWTRASGASIAAPDLVTDLSIGDRGVLGRLEREVRQRGYFEWHSWAEKDTLSPGRWIVSLTYPDGRPVTCGEDHAACQMAVDIG